MSKQPPESPRKRVYKKRATRKKKARAKKSDLKYPLKKSKYREQRKFSLRQIQYKNFRLKGMTQYEAALAAGYSPKTARHHAWKIERLVKRGIIDELNRAGGTSMTIAEELVHMALHAEKLEDSVVEIKEIEDGNRKMKQRTVKREAFPDLALRLKSLELIAKLKRHLSSDEPAAANSYTQLVVVLSPEEKKTYARKTNRVDAAAEFGVSLTD